MRPVFLLTYSKPDPGDALTSSGGALLVTEAPEAQPPSVTVVDMHPTCPSPPSLAPEAAETLNEPQVGAQVPEGITAMEIAESDMDVLSIGDLEHVEELSSSASEDGDFDYDEDESVLVVEPEKEKQDAGMSYYNLQ